MSGWVKSSIYPSILLIKSRETKIVLPLSCQFIMVLPTTIQCVTVAAIVMMIISLIFIPNPICSPWVAFSIISIEIGVVGFMTVWDVYLDSISMINLIMCIGFSVDFSAHISYHFMSRVDMTVEERVSDR